MWIRKSANLFSNQNLNSTIDDCCYWRL